MWRRLIVYRIQDSRFARRRPDGFRLFFFVSLGCAGISVIIKHDSCRVCGDEMHFSLSTLILRFVVSFICMQSVAVAGSLIVFRLHRNKKAWLWMLPVMVYLNSAYLFLFNQVTVSPQLKTLLDYFLMYPFFAYMLVCIVLTPFFIVSGVIVLLIKLYAALQKGDTVSAKDHPVDEERRDFLKIAASGIMLPMAGSSLYGSYIGKNRLRVEHLELAFSDLPDGMDGFTLAQISDIHTGPFMVGQDLAAIVRKINSLEPDITVITGDIINWGSSYIEEAAVELSRLQSRAGVFAVLGNHDFYCNTAYLCARLETAGIQVIRDQYRTVSTNASTPPVYLVGLDDPLVRGYAADQSQLLRRVTGDIPERGFKILLSHRPAIFDHAAAEGIPLTLAGHTHAGQAIMPNPGGHGLSLARIAHVRDYGLYTHNNSYLYINRGIGVVGPPVRINCPREISRIVLREKV